MIFFIIVLSVFCLQMPLDLRPGKAQLWELIGQAVGFLLIFKTKMMLVKFQ